MDTYGFDAARRDPDGVAILVADWGGQILATVRMKYARCSEKALKQLLKDLDAIAWPCNEGRGTSIHYERASVGTWVEGGMGGGEVLDGLWLHPEFGNEWIDLDILGMTVNEILEGRSERLPPELLRDRGAGPVMGAKKKGRKQSAPYSRPILIGL